MSGKSEPEHLNHEARIRRLAVPVDSLEVRESNVVLEVGKYW